ncbi:hypothetical protein J7T55_010655 [Diaporthe amygdali]|uniref:uncharacterized protein n=1 Tax=Phomopsis amygdali TaxID=1214568 RepID=UPI0022FDD3EE|nr:uncharacterized protein J7T55_010655 [Diaporthe amygdali]KAJ0114267.1 hypothetical protein J7T55_010655 [Diaporthe amygdali]
MSNMMKPVFNQDDAVIFDDKYLGAVVQAKRVKPFDFYVYDVNLIAEKGETGDPKLPYHWPTIPVISQPNVSDYRPKKVETYTG